MCFAISAVFITPDTLKKKCGAAPHRLESEAAAGVLWEILELQSLFVGALLSLSEHWT